MTSTWRCPKCKRHFTRKNQRHACGTGNRAEVLRNRSAELIRLYTALESFAKSLGSVEVVTRERYVLLRTNRIFADLTVMTDALRLAIHLGRKAEHKLFIKVGADRKHVTHVVKLRDIEELEAMKPYLREAYEYSIS
jgi:predicted transport protein